jgi:HEAT repeat protein
MPLIRKPADTATPLQTSAPGRLHAGTVDERWAAARDLATAGDVGALSGALAAETDPRVREALLTSLARIGSPAAAQALIPYVRSDDASVRTGALDALSTMPAGVAGSLAGLLADPDPDVRLLACELARSLPGPEPAAALCALIDRDPAANVCAAAIEVLAEVGGPEALPALARCADRFAGEPFLVFAARVAAQRIGADAVG